MSAYYSLTEAGRTRDGRSTVADIVTIEEEAKRHKDEWLLFEVTEMDEIDQPVKGRLLHHAKARSEVHREVMKVRDKLTCVFFTGPLVPPDMIMVPTWVSMSTDQE